MSEPAPRKPAATARHDRWDRLRWHYGRQLAPHLPLHLPLRRLWRAGRSAACRTRVVVAAAAGVVRGGYRGLEDVTRVRWLSPRRIVRCSGREFPVPWHQGRVVGGDWDLEGQRFDDLDIVAALAAVVRDGRPWRETTFYRRTLALIEDGGVPWGCATAADLDARCRELSRLYDAIRTGGYLQRGQIPEPAPGTGLPPSEGEVGVSIGRDGEPLFSDGAHRLAIAKLLALETIPVQIAVRHPGWFAVRKELLQLARRHGGLLPQPVLHPDLAELPAREDADALLALLAPRLPPAPATVLEWGAALGYVCHRLDERGFACAAHEPDAELARMLAALQRAEPQRVTVLGADDLAGWAGVPGAPRILLALDMPCRGAAAADLEALRRKSGATLSFLVLPPGQEPAAGGGPERIAVLADGRALWQTGGRSVQASPPSSR